MSVDFDRLNDVVKATELLPLGRFDMGTVVCGTAGCMIGNYNALVSRRAETFGRRAGHMDWVNFGITEYEYFWLFEAGANRLADEDRLIIDLASNWVVKYNNLDDVPREAALARLRKFIAYKRRKHELIHDEKYGVRDEARRAEGNQLFAVLAVQDALAEMSLATAN